MSLNNWRCRLQYLVWNLSTCILPVVPGHVSCRQCTKDRNRPVIANEIGCWPYLPDEYCKLECSWCCPSKIYFLLAGYILTNTYPSAVNCFSERNPQPFCWGQYSPYSDKNKCCSQWPHHTNWSKAWHLHASDDGRITWESAQQIWLVGRPLTWTSLYETEVV